MTVKKSMSSSVQATVTGGKAAISFHKSRDGLQAGVGLDGDPHRRWTRLFGRVEAVILVTPKILSFVVRKNNKIK